MFFELLWQIAVRCKQFRYAGIFVSKYSLTEPLEAGKIVSEIFQKPIYHVLKFCHGDENNMQLFGNYEAVFGTDAFFNSHVSDKQQGFD